MNWRTCVGLITIWAGITGDAFAVQAKAPFSATDSQANSEYRMGAEDLIECFIYKQPELTTIVVVRPDGMISLPLIGELKATGKTASELQKEITTKLKEYISDPVVNVIVKEINSPKISIFGEVHKPAVFPIKQKTTVLDAIAMAGGFTEFAKRDRVIVIRSASGTEGQKRIKLNLDQLIKEGEPFYLLPSDTVFVE